MQLIMSLINLTGSSQRRVQKLKLIYGILYRISVKYFEFNLNENIDFAARFTIIVMVAYKVCSF